MKQSAFIKLCLFISLLGILILFTITPDISPQSTIIEGEIINVNNMDAVSFIEFIPYDLTVLSFSPTNKTGSARLIGRLASYDGKLEFIVDEVR